MNLQSNPLKDVARTVLKKRSLFEDFGILLVMLTLSVFVLSHNASAEISFIHDSRFVELGPAGTEVQMDVIVSGLHRKDSPLNIEMVRDGKLTHLVAQTNKYTPKEEPIFTLSLASPVAGLVYRFNIRDDDGSTTTSDYFWSLQQCQESMTKESSALMNLKEQYTHDEQSNLSAGELAVRASHLEKLVKRSALAEKRLVQLSEILRGPQ